VHITLKLQVIQFKSELEIWRERGGELICVLVGFVKNANAFKPKICKIVVKQAFAFLYILMSLF
jgi:hypothetical protein